MSKKKIYIAGRVTGLPKNKVIKKFFEAQQELEKLGFEVINPIRVVNNWKTPWNTAMKQCIVALLDCDAVYMLSDWEKSKGAKVEYNIALSLQIPIYTDKYPQKHIQWNSSQPIP